MSFTLFSYILCIFVCGLVEKTANSKKWRTYSELWQISREYYIYRKTLQYFHVPIAYKIQQIIYKTMGLSILVSIFEGAREQKMGLKSTYLKYDFGKSLSKEM